MSKFKVGDKVRVSGWSGPHEGREATVTGPLSGEASGYWIKFLDGTVSAALDKYLVALEPADPQTAEPRPQFSSTVEREAYDAMNRSFPPAAAQANQGARGLLPDVPLAAHKELQAENAEYRIENERLRKELELEKATKLKCEWVEHPACDHEATISKLREFSEGQARQIRGLEIALGEANRSIHDLGDIRDMADKTNGRLTRELEKLKRGHK